MRKSIIFLLFISIFTSCKKEPTSWDVDALVPLLTTKMTLQQAIPDSLINVGTDGELNLVYKGNLLEFNLDSVFAIPDTEMVSDFILPPGATVILQPGQTFLSDTISSPYDMQGAQITMMSIGSGIFHVYVKSSIPGDLILDYAIPSATLNGQMFFVQETIPKGTIANPTVVGIDYDISKYDVDLTGANNNEFNIIATQFRLYADPNGPPITMHGGDKLVMGNTLQDILPSYARGYFGTKLISENAQNEPLEAFKNVIAGTMNLEEVTLDFNIKNEIGVDIEVDISNLVGHNSFNNTDVALAAPIINKTLNLNRATETGNPANRVNASNYQTLLDKNNSNVTEFFSNLPNELTYQIGINLNPLGNVSGSNDFVYDSTGIAIELDAEIPVKLSANNLTIVDTSDFNLDATSQDDIKKIQSGYLNVHANNWFPFSLESQFYMVDENNVIIDSVFATPQILSSGVPVSGRVLDPTSSILQAKISGSKIDNLYKTKYIISKLKINTPGTEKLQIYDNYLIDLKIIGDFKYLITIN